MSTEELRSLYDTVMRNMEFFDSPPREFEHVSLTFELIVSASCFAQLKRHRISTQTYPDYDLGLGVTIPPSIAETGLEEDLREHVSKAEQLYERIKAVSPEAACYALTNAHRRRVVMTANLRELYHVIRLREDKHAQWDIRALATEMRKQAERVMPLGTLLLCGKDTYVERFTSMFGRPPRIDPADL